MAYIGRQQSSGAFLKLDDLSSQFDDSTTTFNLTIGSEAYYPDNPYTLMVSLGGVIQEAITSFTITVTCYISCYNTYNTNKGIVQQGQDAFIKLTTMF